MRCWRDSARRDRCFIFRNRGDRGFTLIELVVVMSILAILATAVTLSLTNKARYAKRARALQDIKTLETAIDLYAADNGQAPTTEQGLDALRHKPTSPPVPANWNGPYIKKAPIDPWGMTYEYRSPGTINPDGYDIVSYGEDKKAGGTTEYDQDLTNADEE